MKCRRCEVQFTAQSAMVTDHKYVQECIDALKGRIREMEKAAHPPIFVASSTAAVTSSRTSGVVFGFDAEANATAFRTELA